MTPPSSSPTGNASAKQQAQARASGFDAFAQGQDPVDVEAAFWVFRRREGLDASGQARLRAWLEADPRHAAAFDALEATLGQVRQMPAAEVALLRAPRPAAPKAPAPARQVRWLPQAAMAAVVALVVGTGWWGWDSWQRQPTFEQAWSTPRGQTAVATLPDAPGHGSTVQLDTATHLQARLFRDRREVVLENGQAMFSVHADASRPFHVRAGELDITVVGTRFSVRHVASGLDAGSTVVSVEEGRVRVTRAAGSGRSAQGTSAATEAAPEPLELTAGQMVVGSADGRIGAVARIPPGAVAQWRSGRVSFDQVPLSQALAEFERYGPTGLIVTDPAVASLPVGGSYGLRQARHFAETLPQVLPVRLVRRGDLTEIVAR